MKIFELGTSTQIIMDYQAKNVTASTAKQSLSKATESNFLVCSERIAKDCFVSLAMTGNQQASLRA